MIRILKMIYFVGAIFVCCSCYASHFTISIDKQNNKKIVYRVQGRPSSLNALKKQLDSYDDKSQIILVRANKKIDIADIFTLFKLIKSAGFKAVILNSSTKEDKNKFSYMHIPIQLKDIKFNIEDIPIPPTEK